MRWYKRLFVKIFLSIWLASFVVLAATILIVGAVAEKEKFRGVVVASAQGYAERIIERYERNGLRPFRRPPELERWRYEREERDDDDRHRRDWYRDHDHDRYDRWKKKDKLRITDLERRVMVVGPPRGVWRKDIEVISFRLISDNQRRYRVDVALDWEHSPVGHFIRTMLSIQVVLILLVSAIAASLLTWIIVGPLNRLRDHTQALYSGELNTRADEKLRSRGDEIGELAREFDRMAEYVEQTLTSHQKLMQDVSHELRAPLARLQAAAGLAEQRWGDDKIVSRITRECQRLDALIGEILSLSRLENSEASGKPFELAELLEELLEDVRFSSADREIRFDAARCRCQVEGNPALLERALNNVLGNACKHTAEGVAIDINLNDVNEQCVLSIRDHGSGVAPSALPHLFEPFYRNTSNNNGYGLGLSIAQRAVQRLGGSIEAKNHPEGGLEVIICLPKHRV